MDNKYLFFNYDNKRERAFVYQIEEGFNYQIYFPDRPTRKHRTSAGSLVGWWRFLPESGELVVITKSWKDCFYLRQFDIPAIFPVNGERVLLDEARVQELRRRFTNVIVLLDNDRTGLAALAKYRRVYGLPVFHFAMRGPKDFADYLKAYQVPGVLHLIETFKAAYL
jgi:hypothetical protein